MAKPPTYIVYNVDTLIIKETFGWMGKDLFALLKNDNSLRCINVTNPKAKVILSSINTINNTNYQ